MISAPIVYQNSEIDSLLLLFLFVDRILSVLPKEEHPGPKGSLNDTELITLALFRFHLGFKDWKHTYRCFKSSYYREFPHLPAYKNFLGGINRVSLKALWILGILMYVGRRDNRLLKIVDSTPLPVCKKYRTFTHKVMKQFASKGHNSQGVFYGLKLHAVVDTLGNLLSIRLTTGRVNDREPVLSMLRDIFGTILADAGYVSAPLKEKLFSLGKDFITGVRKNMKQLLTKSQHELLKKRQWVETIFSQIKDRLGMVTSLPRSPKGMIAHYIFTLLAYQIFKVLNINS